MMSMNLSNIAILNIIGADRRCVINGIREIKDINLLQNADLTEKRYKHNFSLLRLKER